MLLQACVHCRGAWVCGGQAAAATGISGSARRGMVVIRTFSDASADVNFQKLEHSQYCIGSCRASGHPHRPKLPESRRKCIVPFRTILEMPVVAPIPEPSSNLAAALCCEAAPKVALPARSRPSNGARWEAAPRGL
eukprot:15460158-Alexandrium_andersonii.AAC.1